VFHVNRHPLLKTLTAEDLVRVGARTVPSPHPCLLS
jgi:hypothetical protein